MSDRPIIVAHRGLHHDAPENSWTAFRAAWRAGIEWVECDVQGSADNWPIVIHDDTLDRTTMGIGPVSQCSSDSLSKLHLRSTSGEVHWTHVPVLRLPDEHDERGALLVEIKPPDNTPLVKRVAVYLRRTRRTWAIQSFDRANVRHAQRHAACRPHALLVADADDLHRAIQEGWRHINAPHAVIDRAIVHAIHRDGRSMGAWTVNRDEDIRRMIDLGVDMIITDEPLRARELVRQHYA